YLRRCASVLASVMSFTATNSSAPSSRQARSTLRPIRPKPLMPTRIVATGRVSSCAARAPRVGAAQSGIFPYPTFAWAGQGDGSAPVGRGGGRRLGTPRWGGGAAGRRILDDRSGSRGAGDGAARAGERGPAGAPGQRARHGDRLRAGRARGADNPR